MFVLLSILASTSWLTFLLSDMPWHFNLTIGYYNTGWNCGLQKEQF